MRPRVFLALAIALLTACSNGALWWQQGGGKTMCGESILIKDGSRIIEDSDCVGRQLRDLPVVTKRPGQTIPVHLEPSITQMASSNSAVVRIGSSSPRDEIYDLVTVGRGTADITVLGLCYDRKQRCTAFVVVVR